MWKDLRRREGIFLVDWAAQAAQEGEVALLIESGADPNGLGLRLLDRGSADLHTGFPLSRALTLCLEAKKGSPKASALRIALRLLVARANPNRVMSLNRWHGTPLAFSWRVLGSRNLTLLVLHHGAELFTDSMYSIGGAICGEVARRRGESLAKLVISGLLDVNKQYAWGVALSAFAIYEDACTRHDMIRTLLAAGADPTLAFKHTLFKLHGFSTDLIKPYNLSGLAAILNEVEDATRIWPSGKTLAEAWEEAESTSFSKGSELFRAAADPSVTRVGFDAGSTAQRDAAEIFSSRGFCSEGVWGMVKRLPTGASHLPALKGLSMVAQFQNEPRDSVRLWLRNSLGLQNKPYCVAERAVPVKELDEQWIGDAENEFSIIMGIS